MLKIFPTSEEILSNEVNFLPSTDPNQPHFLSEPAERHFDAHFRLLRHDTFSQLEELLGIVMDALGERPLNPRLHFGDFQYARAYKNLQIQAAEKEATLNEQKESTQEPPRCIFASLMEQPP